VKSTVENLSPTRVRLSVEVPFEEIKPSLDAAYKKIGSQIRIPGFRPGKAPAAVVRKKFAEAIRQEAIEALVQEAFKTVLERDKLDLATQPPAVILMAGLQGAGKTTTTAKLAKHLIEKRRKKVLTVSADVYRPAAIEQLKLVTRQAGAEWFPSSTSDSPLAIATSALDHAKRHYFDVLLVDTAGRLGIDAELAQRRCRRQGAGRRGG